MLQYALSGSAHGKNSLSSINYVTSVFLKTHTVCATISSNTFLCLYNSHATYSPPPKLYWTEFKKISGLNEIGKIFLQ